MRFASSGEEALKALEQTPCDVVVSDMRMSGMDGAQLLSTVQERYPRLSESSCPGSPIKT